MKQQQSFKNETEKPMYVGVEPWPEYFELEKGDVLTIVHDAPANGDAIQVDYVEDNELRVWPMGEVDDLKILFNGQPADNKSWNFKHR